MPDQFSAFFPIVLVWVADQSKSFLATNPILVNTAPQAESSTTITILIATTKMKLRRGFGCFALAVSLLNVPVFVQATNSCERLKATLTYTQEDAPRDLSTVVRKKLDSQ
jgi:hypothetical protein